MQTHHDCTLHCLPFSAQSRSRAGSGLLPPPFPDLPFLSRSCNTPQLPKNTSYLEFCFPCPLGSLSVSLSRRSAMTVETHTTISIFWPLLREKQKTLQFTDLVSWRFLDFLLKQQNLSLKTKIALALIFIQQTFTELLCTRH